MSDIESTIRIHDDFTESLKDISSSLKETIMMSDRTERSVFALGESFADAGGAIGDAISSLKESNNVLEGLLGAFDALSSSDVLMDLADNFDRLSDKYERLVKKVDFGGGEFFKTSFRVIKSSITNNTNAIKSAFKETASLAKNLKNSLSFIYEDEGKDFISSKMKNISDYGKSVYRTTVEADRKLKDSFRWIYEDDVKDYLSPKLKKISELGKKAYGNTIGNLANSEPAIWATDLFKGTRNAYSMASAHGATTREALLAGSKHVRRNVVRASSKAYSEAREFLGSDDAMNKLSKMFENTKTSVVNAANRAYGVVTDVLDKGRGIVMDNVSRAKAFAHELSIGATNARELAMMHGASNTGGYVAAGKNVSRTLKRTVINAKTSAAETISPYVIGVRDTIGKEVNSLKQISQTFQATSDYHLKTYINNLKGIKFPSLIDGSEQLTSTLKETFNYHVESFTRNMKKIKFTGLKETAVDFGTMIKGGLGETKDYIKTLGGIGKAFAKDLIKETMKSSIFRALEKGLERFIESLKDLAKDVYQKQKEIISRNIENIGRQDKVTAMYGKAGSDDIEAKALEFGNAIGQSNETVASLLTEGAYRGLGTNNTMRLLKLSDKISSLKPGATFEDTARSLIDNFVSGHDASGLSQMLNQGQKGERSARRMGFERALNAGNLDKALDIAEKITEQAGYTDEKYASTQNSLSKTYTRVYNTINSLKSKLDEIIARSLSPMLERMDKFLTSSGGKRFMDTLIAGASLWGKALNFAMTKLLDMLESLGNSVVVLGVVKVWLLIRQFRMLVKTIKFIGPIIMKYVLPAIGFITNKVVILGSKLKLVSAAFAQSTKEIGFMKTAMNSLGKVMIRTFLPILLVAGVLVGAVKGMEALMNSNATDDSERVNTIGVISGSLMFIKDVLGNIFVCVGDVLDAILHPMKSKMLQKPLDEIKRQGAADSARLASEKWVETLQKAEENDRKYNEAVAAAQAKFAETGDEKELKFDLAEAEEYAKLSDNFYMYAEEDRKHFEELNKISENLNRRFEQTYNGRYKTLDDIMDDYDKAVQAKTWGEMADVTGLTGVWDNMFGVVNDIKKELGLVVEDGKDIKSDTDVIRRANEQEEELRWMKAFSDRQITSSYNNMTSNTRNVTINGMSQAGIAEMGRRSISAMPSRKAG